MTGSGLPGGGFRWEEPAARQGRSGSWRRWWWLAAVVVVVALVAGGMFAVLHRRSAGGGIGAKDTTVAARPWPPPVGSPADLLVSFPLDHQPAPAWQKTAADLGLPPDADVGEFFGTSGTSAFFLADKHDPRCGPHDPACPPPEGWVYGIDTRTGESLFAPVALPGYEVGADCYPNGPSVAVCLLRFDSQTVWVIDLDKGQLLTSGPTDLMDKGDAKENPHVFPVSLRSEDSRLLISLEGKGIYGVSPEGQRSWFLPGSGRADPPNSLYDDIPPLEVAVQYPWLISNTSHPPRAFSVNDGTDLTPTPPPGLQLVDARVYNGGFLYNARDSHNVYSLLFYDPTGKLVAQLPTNGAPILQTNAVMPTIFTGTHWEVYTADGKLVLQIPAPPLAVAKFKIIGTKLYVNESYAGDWRQWDLLTGQPGASCHLDLDDVDYIASDGNIVLTDTSGGRYFRTRATDMTTCETLWETPEQDSIKMWRAGSALLQRNHTANTLAGLHAPN